MKQQTSVEWIEYELGRRQGIIDSEPEGLVKQSMYANLYVDLFDQANEMEKQQIIDAYNEGYREGELDGEKFEGDISKFSDALLYYKRTYTDKIA